MIHHILARCFLQGCLAAGIVGPALAQDALPPVDAHYLAPDLSTASAAVAVGPDGSLHMAAASYNHGGDGEVVYAVCASACADGANWRRAVLPVPDVMLAEIAVTPTGAPRLLITAGAADTSGGRDFLYAECGTKRLGLFRSDCSDPDAWSIARVAGSFEVSLSDFFELLLPRHNFALDPAGNPRFIFTDANYLVEPDRYGTYYMSCDAACTDPKNWVETDLANHLDYRTEQFSRPALALGPSGSAHVLALVYAFEPDGTELPEDLYYYECAADCSQRANWHRTAVINPGSGSYPSPTWDLAIDSNGHPRAAVFIGGAPEEADLAYSLIYFWCNADCTGADAWSGQVLETGSFGEAPALALDGADRPRIAFLSPGAEPAIAVCAAHCEDDASEWSSRYLEGEPDMAAGRPTALPFTCDGELWNALMPDLAVGADGSSFVAYDVSVQARCLYQEYLEPEITYEFHEIWRGARLAALP